MSNGSPYVDASVDLTNCDREPIHIPGAIQPHGVLLGVTEPDLVIVQASNNTEVYLGIPHDELLGATLPSILPPDGMSALSVAIQESAYRRVNGQPMSVRGRVLEAILHRSEGLLVIELEDIEEAALRDPTAAGMPRDLLEDCTAQAHAALDRLQDAPKLADLWPTLATVVREITGFDRVMVYRFSEQDGSGEVIAEDRRGDLEPYLGLHYPASDIPQQARRLYTFNRLRIIPDAQYTPVPILPPCNPLTGRPLDLSYSVLRSVSPIHCEYLANMGVRASMSISLVKDERLWGLIACHHLVPRRLPYRTRALCELLADICSWILGPRLEIEENRLRMEAGSVQHHLVEAMATQTDLALALTTSTPSALDLVEAGGFVLADDNEQSHLGETPSRKQTSDLVQWLSTSMDGPVYATDALPAAYPPAQGFADRACGLLAAAVSRAHGLYLLWFRPELVREVRWSGDPRKPAEMEGERLTPRKSFALWRETVRHRSRPWAEWEIDAAGELRSLTATVVLQRAAEGFRLSLGLQEALRSRDEFLTLASHELRTPMQTLMLQIEALELASAADRLPPMRLARRLALARRQVARLERLVTQLLDVSRLSAGRFALDRKEVDLAALARALASRFTSAGVSIDLDARGDTTGSWDELRLEQVLDNLVSNAVKYGRGQPVDIDIRGQDTTVRCSVRDRGIGIAPEEQGKLFERFARAVPTEHFTGLGLGLWLAREIIEQHGGTIEVQSEPGQGATFTFTLPRGRGHT